MNIMMNLKSSYLQPVHQQRSSYITSTSSWDKILPKSIHCVRLVLIDLCYSYSYDIVTDMGVKPQPKKLKADPPELSLKA